MIVRDRVRVIPTGLNLLKPRQWLSVLGLTVGLIGIPGCWRPPEPKPDPDALKPVESLLALKDVTLEESDLKGKVLWQIKAKQVQYSPDHKVATVKAPTGELFQDGKPIYRFTAQSAQIRQDLPDIKFLGQVRVKELENQVILRSAMAEWKPKQNLIEIPTPLTITHAKLQASATQGKIFSRAQRAELTGHIIAVTQEPHLKMTTDRLNWQIDTQQLTTQSFVQVEHYLEGQISDRGQGHYLLADQKQKTVLLEKQAQVVLQDPPLNIASESLLWDLQNRKVTSQVPLQIVHRQEKMTINAQQGWVDLPSKVYYLTGQIQGNGEKQQATFTSDKFTWFMSTNQFSAEGNFVYEQRQPKFSSRSPVAQGEFKEQFVVLHGDQTRVETEIIPNAH